MSSKKKNAAKKAAATQVAGDNKPADAKVENKATVATEKGKAEATQQVAAPAATEQKKPEPLKEKPAAQPKKEEKAKAAPEQSKTSTQKEKKDKKTPTVIAEEVNPEEKLLRAVAGIPHSSEVNTGRNSTDTYAMLAYVGHERFGKNKELAEKCPELYKSINRAIDVVYVLAMIGVQNDMKEMDKQGKIQLLAAPDQVIDLKEAAEMVGIKLIEPKALPGGNGDQLAIEFDNNSIPEELREIGPAPEKPELEIENIKTDDQIKAALDYLMRNERNVVLAIAQSIEWLRELRTYQNANGKAIQLDSMTVFDWITEIFNLITPTPLFKGLGTAIYNYTKLHGSPIAAHTLVHASLREKGWDEEQVASIVKAMLNENFRLKKVENPDLKATDDKAICAVVNNLGDDYLDTVIANLSLDIKDDDPNKNQLAEDKKNAQKLRNLVCMNYFPSKYTPTPDELRMALGQIINLYRDPMNRLSQYHLASGQIGKVEGEYPETAEETKAEEKKN